MSLESWSEYIGAKKVKINEAAKVHKHSVKSEDAEYDIKAIGEIFDGVDNENEDGASSVTH